MKRTTLAHSRQDRSPLHPFMIFQAEGPNFMKKLNMGALLVPPQSVDHIGVSFKLFSDSLKQ